jgi:coenzyme F420-reducing hydrogenase alpha subunit
MRAMRRVMYCGEWMQSHSLHIHLLAAPDFLGFGNVIEMAKAYPAEVRRGLKLQALGNDLITLFGGRSVHPVGVCVGGFRRAPEPAEVEAIVQRLEEALPEAAALVDWCASLKLPDDEQVFTSVALSHPEEYAIGEGCLCSDQGLDIGIDDYEKHFREFQEPHSTALHAHLDGKPYLVGPLARLNLNQDKLPEPVRESLEKTGISFPSTNMFHSMVARAVELHLVVYEALRLLRDYESPKQPRVEVMPRAGVSFGATEAPRGLLWHRYEMDDYGLVRKARIVPPTSQNQARMEQDLRASLEALGLDKEDEALQLHAETVIRNYDPCISCATHFLTLDVTRR